VQKPWVRAPLGLRPFLDRDYLRFEAAHAAGTWVQPAEATVTLLIEVKEPLRVNGARLPHVWISGPSTRPDHVELGRAHDSLDLKLTPLGAYSLIGWPLRQLAGEIVGLDDLFGRAGTDLTNRLLEARSPQRRVEILEDFLLHRAAGSKLPTPAVAYAWQRLDATGGRLPITKLADELGMSRRHLTATFHEQVGLSPKKAARLLRFAHVRQEMQRAPVRWAEIAAECGYVDQSHLHRDFRDFAGSTPAAFLGSRAAEFDSAGDGPSFHTRREG
jgi:AraC-like DNA-binding protein